MHLSAISCCTAQKGGLLGPCSEIPKLCQPGGAKAELYSDFECEICEQLELNQRQSKSFLISLPANLKRYTRFF